MRNALESLASQECEKSFRFSAIYAGPVFRNRPSVCTISESQRGRKRFGLMLLSSSDIWRHRKPRIQPIMAISSEQLASYLATTE